MALRNFLRFLLITPIQISIFLLISLPLALFAAITTFFSVIFLSSRLLLVYVDLVVSLVFASASPPPSKTTGRTGELKLNTSSHHPSGRHPYPLTIPRSPPRSPPRSGSSGWKPQSQRGGYYQQSFTAPSSPNIGRKRMALAGGFYSQPLQQQQQVFIPTPSGASSSSSGSPPLSMKGGFGKTSSVAPPPPYSYEGSGAGRGKKGPVVILDPGEEDYFTGGTEE